MDKKNKKEKNLKECYPTGGSVNSSRLIHELEVYQIELEMQNDELQRSNRYLEELEGRYFELFNLAPLGYLCIDKEGIIKEANLTFSQLIDVPRSDIINKHFTKFILPADQDIQHFRCRDLWLSKERAVYNIHLIKADKSAVWVRIDAKIVTKEDSDICWMQIGTATENKVID